MRTQTISTETATAELDLYERGFQDGWHAKAMHAETEHARAKRLGVHPILCTAMHDRPDAEIVAVDRKGHEEYRRMCERDGRPMSPPGFRRGRA